MPLRSVSAAYLDQAKDLIDNAGQLAAYESRGHCVVLAGPGSGKTKTLTLKLARSLAEDVRAPRGVACITYSQECARELKRRLERLGLGNVPNLFVGTVHGFCLQHILAPFANLAGLDIPQPVTLATEKQMERIFSTVATPEFGGRPLYNSYEMSRYRRTHLDRDAPSWNENEDLAKLSEDYEKTLRAEGLVDYDDLVVLGNKLVADHDWVLPIIAARWPILAVDEYQDLGIPLHRIVKRLAFDGGVRLFAVGDADQSVYRFAGADGGLLLELAKRSDVETVQLELNYRSAARIIQASELALGEARGYRPHDPQRQAIIAFRLCPDGLEEQASHVVDTLIPQALAAKEGRTVGDIAILYRGAPTGDVFADALEKAGYHYIRVDRAAPYKKVGLTSWIEDCAAWCSGGWRTSQPQLNGLMFRWLGFRSGRPNEREARRISQELAAYLFESRTEGGPAGQFIVALKKRFIDPLTATETSLADQAEQVERMEKAFSAGGKFEAVDVSSLGRRDGSSDHVNMLTLHSSKGCEFDVVIMVGMDQGNMPFTNETAEELAESRRLFYVGLTRARDAVHLLYSGWRDGRFGPQRLGRSVFVDELEQRLTAADG